MLHQLSLISEIDAEHSIVRKSYHFHRFFASRFETDRSNFIIFQDIVQIIHVYALV